MVMHSWGQELPQSEKEPGNKRGRELEREKKIVLQRITLPSHLLAINVGISGLPKVIGHEVFNSCSSLDFQVTKSILGGGREVLPSSRKLHERSHQVLGPVLGRLCPRVPILLRLNHPATLVLV